MLAIFESLFFWHSRCWTCPSGTVDTYNNTFYDCGPFFDGRIRDVWLRGDFEPRCWPESFLSIHQQHFYPTLVEGKYFSSDALTSQITGCSNNLYFQGGMPPTFWQSERRERKPPACFTSQFPSGLSLQTASPALAPVRQPIRLFMTFRVTCDPLPVDWCF